MKTIAKQILSFQEDDYFSPIRSKTDYAKVIMFAARSFLLGNESSAMTSNSKMILVVDKMSRLFFYKQEKYFSLSFPFSIQIKNNQMLSICSYSGKIVDFRSISAVISVLENQQFLINPSPIDFYIDSNEIDCLGLLLLEEIFQFEPSYIRYDKDPENQDGNTHPLYHVDINYSTYGTYKLGLNNDIEAGYLENLTNLNTDCSFINVLNKMGNK